MNSPIIIAIDGPAASGKGTLAKRLALQLGYAHLDTGLLYRAVAVSVLRAGADPDDKAAAVKAVTELDANALMADAKNPVFRDARTSQAASQVAAIIEVRQALLKFQQDFCQSPPGKLTGAVLDGRDIGTVIAPQAPVKLFVIASPEARAQRRFKELQDRGGTDTYDAVLADMQQRDARDRERTVAPAKPADDAVVIDTSSLTADEAFTAALQIVERKLAEQKAG